MGYDAKLKQSIRQHAGKEHPVDTRAYKLRAYQIADILGIKHAKVIARQTRFEYIDWKALPNNFIIKPERGCSTKGVLPVVKVAEGIYEDIMRHRKMTIQDIGYSFMNGLLPDSKEKHSRGLWIEELLQIPLPDDWKVFTFNGEIAFIRQYRRGEKDRCKFWSKEWKPIEIHKKINHYTIDPTLPLPEHPEELLKTAEAISKYLKYPFVRVDLYDIPKGIYIGEITPHPGRDVQYTKEWDKKLGEMWEKAEKELK